MGRTGLKTAKVGGDGGTDYIYADTAGRRLCITRGGTPAQEATETRPAVPASEKRLTIFDLDTLAPVGVINGVGGNGATVSEDGPRFHQRPSPTLDVRRQDHEVDQDDRRSAGFSADGIYCDTSDDRVYTAAIRRRACLWLTPRMGRCSGTSTSAARRADRRRRQGHHLPGPPGAGWRVAVVDAKTMKVTATYPFGDNGGCNGLALDAKNQILFAACNAVGAAPAGNTRTAATAARSQ
jgi:hypothetical protein